MSVFIKSSDVASGQSYNGTWTVPSTLQGTYSVNSQYMSLTGSVPWIWNETRAIRIRNYQWGQTHLIFNAIVTNLNLDYQTIQNETNLTTIASSIYDSFFELFDAQSGIDPSYQRIFSVTADTATNTIHLTFNQGLDFLWPDSSSKYIFNKQDAAEEKLQTDVYLDMSNVGEPDSLEVVIPESASQIVTSHNTQPTLIFNVTGESLTGYKFSIRRPVSELNITLYRPNEPTIPCPVTKIWYLGFEPV